MKGVLAYLMLADENNKANPSNNPAKIIGSFLHTKDASIRFTKAIINKAIMAIKIAKNPPISHRFFSNSWRFLSSKGKENNSRLTATI